MKRPYFWISAAALLCTSATAEVQRVENLSTPHHEFAPAVSPDGRTLCFGVADPHFVGATRAWTVVCSERRGEGWSKPELAPFSGIWSDAYPAFSPDGSRLYFVSDRPHAERSTRARDFDVWWVERSVDTGEPGWSRPQRASISSASDELRPWPTRGALYFASNRLGGAGGFDLWRSEIGDGGELEEPTPVAVSSTKNDIDPWVDPEERFLLFASNRSGGLGDFDLYLSRRAGDRWSEAEHLAALSSSARDDGPSAFGDRLYFSSRRGFADIAPERTLSAEEIRRSLGSVLNGAANLYAAPLPTVLPPLPPSEPVELGPQPEIIGPEVVSTEIFEGHPELTPDGTELYFTAYARNWRYNAVQVAKRQADGTWGRPEVAPFSGRFTDSTTGISPDGQSLYFVSKRPPSEDFDLWRVRRDGHGKWGEPERLPEPLNSPAREFCPSIAADGTLYFMSRRADGHGKGDIYRVPVNGDGWGQVENLGPSINTEHEEGNVYVDPEQTLLLVMADRPEGYGGDDIYLSRRRADGTWGPSRLLPPPINTRENDFSPKLAPDGHTLLFASNRFERTRPVRSYAELDLRLKSVLNGASNLYQIDLRPWLQEKNTPNARNFIWR